MWALAALVAVVMVACSSKPTTGTVGTGGGSATPACEAQRARVEGLYRAEAQSREPKRVDEYVADNTAMVLGECGKAPAIASCVGGAATVQDVERCLPPLDEEGTEGDALAR